MKTCNEIYEQMLSSYEQATGFSMEDTTDLAVRLQAAAAQMESLYAYCDWAMGQSFPQTATGEYLNYHGSLRGIIRKEGAHGTGMLRISAEAGHSQPVTVPAGTVCTTAGLVRFETLQPAVIAAGILYVDIPAQAQEVGAAGNAPAGTICQLSQPPAGVLGCTNPAAFVGGCGEETDEALRERILESFARLPNGANRSFYEQRALAVEGVGGVSVVPRINGAGTVGVAVASQSGIRDEELLARVSAELQAVREIAVDVEVFAPTPVVCNVALTLWPKDTVSFAEAKAAVENAICGYFTGKRLGKPVFLAELGSLIFSTELVKNYHIADPVVDLAVSAIQLPRLGSLLVTEGS